MDPRLPTALAGAALLLAGCGVRTVCFLCEDTDPGDGAPALDLSATAMDFGAVAVGDTSDAPLVLYNTGDRPLSILSAALVGDAPAFTVGPLDDILLDPGARTTLDITFAPVIHGAAREELVVETTDPEAPMRTVSLTGEGMAPVLVVQPDTVILDDVWVGCATDVDLVIANAGNAPLVVERAALEASTSDLAFALAESANGPLPWSLPPATALSLGTLSYDPLDADPHAAVIALGTNDPERPEVDVGISAQADAWGRGEDAWTFPSALVDVVLAVNTSASMQARLAGLVDVLPALTSALDDAGASWRLAAVAQDGGCVAGGVGWLASGDGTDAVTDGLDAMLDVDAGAHADEAFTLLDEALSEDALAEGACNDGLLRDAAGLHLVGVSDVEEASAPDWSWWVAWFQDRATDPGQVAFHGIGSDPAAPCAGMETYTRVAAAASATGGGFVSLCTPDWAGALADLAGIQLAAAPGDPGAAAWPLSADPVPQTLSVQVDGVTWNTGWSWDEFTRSIRFSPASSPEPGSTVTVTYTRAGPCADARVR